MRVVPTSQMPPSRLRAISAALSCVVAVLTAPLANGEIAIVASKTFNGYKREKGPDGNPRQQTFVFGDGGLYRSATAGSTVDSMEFLKIAHTLSPFLREQGFIPCGDPEQTDLLIMVGRGTTLGSESLRESTFNYLELALREAAAALERAGSPSIHGGSGQRFNAADAAIADQASMSYLMAVNAHNEARDQLDYRNAKILGIAADMEHALLLSHTVFGRDLAEDVGFNRVFVVVSAYDFKTAAKEKKLKLLWETRYSIREHGNDFRKQLPFMTQTASHYFGRSTHGIARRPLAEHIQIGPLQVVDEDVTR